MSAIARRLAGALEPVAGQVFFSPECHQRYAALGHNPSPGQTGEGVALPDGPAYFCSRAASMGQVPGEVVAATFAVFNPAVVVPAVTHGWSIADASTMAAERRAGAVEQLTRILGAAPDGVDRAGELLARAAEPLRPEGRGLFAGVLSLDEPTEPLARVWYLSDLIREYRGDSHTAAWITAGFDATEIGLLTELYWGLPMRSYVRTRAWSDTDLDAACDRLTARGLIADGSLTDEGRTQREAVEEATDTQMRPALDALGDDLDELLGILEPWGAEIRAQRGYLPGGPHELAPR